MEAKRYSGRLELTWTNKALRLLADDTGAYEWVPAADYRVAEVRLFDDAGVVGQTRSHRARARDNLLIRGDALIALRRREQRTSGLRWDRAAGRERGEATVGS